MATQLASNQVNGVALAVSGTDSAAFTADLALAVGKRLVVDTTITLTSAHTIPTTVELEIRKGGLLVDGGGATLQINGGFICDPKNQAFSGFSSGEVVFDTGGYSNAVERVGYPEWWGIDGTNDEVEINACIAACRNTILTGQYVQDAAVIMPYDESIPRHVIGLNQQATLLCNVNNITQVHWSGFFCSMRGVNINGNGKTGTIGLKLATSTDVDDKSDATWQATLENQNHNVFEDLRFRSMDSGIVLACGAHVGGTDSNMYHNKFQRMEFFDCLTRAILFRDMTQGANPAIWSGANANYFERPTFLGTMATGVDIQAGGGNVFIAPHFENITKSINVANTMSNTGECPRNVFLYAHEENVSTNSTISNQTTLMLFHDIPITGTVNTEIPMDPLNSGGQYFLAGIRSTASGTEKFRFDDNSNFMVGVSAVGTNQTGALGVGIGTEGSSSPADMAQMWVQNIGGTDGQAQFHIKGEQGTSGVIPACVYKTTTGDPSPTYESLMCINTVDNTVKIYADGAWRTLASGW